ncbi:MAG: hypothetical protein Q8L56_15160 [Rhodocyclaceae bacterium]|nr:hypothetical protein [Rhodocyclaceae bacterium]
MPLPVIRTQVLTPQTVLGRVDADVRQAIECAGAYRQLAMVDFAKAVLPSEAEVAAVLAAAAQPKPAAELIASMPTERQAFVFRALAWLVKLGVLRVVASGITP